MTFQSITITLWLLGAALAYRRMRRSHTRSVGLLARGIELALSLFWPVFALAKVLEP